MSVSVDVNVLVYASNESDPAHDAARTLLEGLAAGSSLLLPVRFDGIDVRDPLS